jgi:hypothetical protein
MKNTVLSLALGALALSGCTELVVAETAASIYLTRPSKPPFADTRNQIPAHETWCYSTMADSECYTTAQNVSSDRLINVDPQNRYPLTPQAYRDELAGRSPTPAATAKPTELGSSKPVPATPNSAEKESFMKDSSDSGFPKPATLPFSNAL